MPTTATDERKQALALVEATARLLFTNGQTTERTVHAVVRLGKHLGFNFEVTARWGEFTLRSLEEDGSDQITVLSLVPMGVEMHKVMEALHIVDKVCSGALTVGAALTQLNQVAKLKPVSLLRFGLLAALGASALAVIGGATQPLVLLIVFASTLAGACLRRGIAHAFPSPLPQPLGAAFLAGLVATAASWFLPPESVFLIALCPCMVLVPGPHLLNGTLDIAHLRVPLGAARLAYGSVIILLISIGLISGLVSGGRNLPLAGGLDDVPLIIDMIAAALAVAAYGTFFSMPWRMLPFPMVVGMLAHALHWLGQSAGLGLALPAFIACLFVGCVVTPLANRLRLPFAAVAFASVVSLVPGSFVFRMCDNLIQLVNASAATAPPLLFAAMVNGTNAATILIAMAFGLILPKTMIEDLFPPRYLTPERS
ncbi:threonine/serine exporter family protein [Aquabacter cavernae]|uniref:threonine/serine exporter family protein n=1 Tax=Aquabacter cavernae TaxID=2496029 RepID=UPI000F8EE417|nr:threonine/serine exporter family protein [Aquabacter cavernae]